MIAYERLSEIRRLLEQGRISQRQIAHMAGVSRGTVRAIARDPTFTDRRRDVQADRLPRRGRIPRRCRTCGGLVYPPCKLCKVRAYVARMRCYYSDRQRVPTAP